MRRKKPSPTFTAVAWKSTHPWVNKARVELTRRKVEAYEAPKFELRRGGALQSLRRHYGKCVQRARERMLDMRPSCNIW
eukprot:5499239-Pyramimonas_sp.AAC.1